MRPRKTADQWFAEYGESHQDHANELIHWVCVPVIFFCVLGFVWSIPLPAEWRATLPWFNWALVAIAGVTLAPGESFGKDERRFREEHTDHWIVISAIASDRHPGMVECVAARGGVRRRGPERAFLVPQDEYRDRGRFGFVIDEARHALCDRRPESET